LTKELRQENEKVSGLKTYTVPIVLNEIKEKITLSTNKQYKSSKEKIINHAFEFHSLGNISEAARYYQNFINQGYELNFEK